MKKNSAGQASGNSNADSNKKGTTSANGADNAKGGGKKPKGHRQRGGGTVVADKGPVTTSDGIALKSWQRLPSQVLLEWTQKQKRPKPRYVTAKAFQPDTFRKRCILPDVKDTPAKDLVFAVWETLLPATTETLAKEEAAMLALSHVQPAAPLERVVPDPFRDLWLKTQQAASSAGGVGGTGAAATSSSTAKATTSTSASSSSAPVVIKGLQNEKWNTSEYEKTQWQEKNRVEKTQTANKKEVKKEFHREQAMQPVYFSKKMRLKCITALREHYQQTEQMGAVKNGSKSGTATANVAAGGSSSSSSARTNSTATTSNTNATIAKMKKLFLAVEQADSYSESAKNDVDEEDEQLLSELTNTLGFDRSDAITGVIAVRSTGEDPTIDLVQQWLTLNLPDESLPEQFQVRGQFQRVENKDTKAGTAEKLSRERKARRADFLGWCRQKLRSGLLEDAAAVDSLLCSIELFTESWIAAEQVNAGQDDAQELDEDNLQACCDILEAELIADGVEEPDTFLREVRAKWKETKSSLLELSAQQAKKDEEEAAAQAAAKAKEQKDADESANSNMNDSEEDKEKSQRTLDNKSWFPAGTTGASTSSRQSRTKKLDLPAHKKEKEFLQMVEKNDVTLVLGQTGCGKSTQLPQFLIGTAMNKQQEGSSASSASNRVVCTQPRRLAAVSLARRVAQEFGEDEVGYCVRGDVHIPKNCQLVFCTVGILIKKLLQSHLCENPDQALESGGIDFTHLVIDEAHERSLDIDFLLMLVANHLSSRGSSSRQHQQQDPFKVIVMSATLDKKIFEMFPKAARLEIPGRTFPVKSFNYSSQNSKPGQIDYWGIGEAVSSVLKGEYDDEKMQYGQKAILIFMPGTGEIQRMCRTLVQDFGCPAQKVLPLHGSLPPQEQRKCFDVVAQKIVVATNVCETSITIPDVTCVIDTCRERRLMLKSSGLTSTTSDNSGKDSNAPGFDPPARSVGAQEKCHLRLATLQESFCSKASIEQRKGRAGRVQPGICIRMISRNEENRLADSTPPEMDSLPLENMLLQVCSMETHTNSSLRKFLQHAPTPPTEDAVKAGLGELLAVGAVVEGKREGERNTRGDKDKSPTEIRITPLGKHLAKLPCDVRIGKLLIYGAMLGCASETAGLAAMLSVRNPLLRPKEQEQETNRTVFRRVLLKPGGTKSDHCFLAGLLEWFLHATSRKNRRKDKETEYSALRQLAMETDTCNFLLVGETDPGNAIVHKLGISSESLKEAAKLQQQHLSALRNLGFLTREQTPPHSAIQSPQQEPTSNTRWYMLRAACVAAFFLVKAKKPEVTYKKLASGATVQVPIKPELVRFFPLQRDPFFFKDKIVDPAKPFGNQPGQNIRYFVNHNSVFFSEAPGLQSHYICHTDIFGSNDKMFIEANSEASPLAVLLLGNFSEIEFRQDGLVVVDQGKLVFTTTGGQQAASANTVISQLVHVLRHELLEELLQRKIENPKLQLEASPIVKAVAELLGTDGMGYATVGR
ncbi:unnamed protein product [Amoebophrya sp. A120]|nr:unnamed protein product [Amoebophrya sp. A120]|eukprot:GSA120T00003743001.1